MFSSEGSSYDTIFIFIDLRYTNICSIWQSKFVISLWDQAFLLSWCQSIALNDPQQYSTTMHKRITKQKKIRPHESNKIKTPTVKNRNLNFSCALIPQSTTTYYKIEKTVCIVLLRWIWDTWYRYSISLTYFKICKF